MDVYVGIVNIDRTSFVWTLNVDRDDLWTHDNFTAQTSRNDIGLIYLASKIPPNEFVSFINLPTRADANQKLVGQNGTIIGYERYKKFLQWEQVAFVENDVCEKSFEITLSESYFCILNEIGAKRGYYGLLN